MSAVKRGQGTGHRAQGTGHRAQGTGHRAQGTGYRAQGTGHRAKTGHRARGTGHRHRAQGTGHRAQGAGHRHRAQGTGHRAGRGQQGRAGADCHAPPRVSWAGPSTKPNAKELYQGVGVSPERGVEPTRLKSGGTGKGSKR